MTPKQQRFVQAYVETGNATQSAIKAGYSKRSAMQIGEQNLRKHEIASAITAAQAKAAERHEITLDRISDMLKEDRAFARECNQAGAVVTATMGLAKLHGLIVDRQKAEIVGKIEHSPMTEDDWESSYSGYARRVAPTNGAAKSTH